MRELWKQVSGVWLVKAKSPFDIAPSPSQVNSFGEEQPLESAAWLALASQMKSTFMLSAIIFLRWAGYRNSEPKKERKNPFEQIFQSKL